MRTLLLRSTVSHLLVSLGAVALFAALSPPLFREYYVRAEDKHLRSAAQGIGRAAEALFRRSPDRRNLQVLVTTSAEVIGGRVDLQIEGETIRAGQVSTLAPNQHVTVPLPTAHGSIALSKPLTGWVQMARVQRLVTVLAAAIAGLLSLALAYATARASSAPLVAMSRAAERLAAEDFSVRLPERGPQEIASLARSLNRMAGELERAFSEMHHLDQLRREFVGNASHELRAPLTNIRGFLDAVLDGTAASPEEQTKCLQTASAEARRMTRIVEELLQLSRLQAGVLEFDLAPQDPGDIVASVVAGFEPRLRDRRVNLAVRAETATRASVDGDKIAQVLVNLLDNALRYSPPGATITVAVRPQGERVQVSVADEGPGIPIGKLEEIWERFHKADPSRPRTEPGSRSRPGNRAGDRAAPWRGSVRPPPRAVRRGGGVLAAGRASSDSLAPTRAGRQLTPMLLA